MSGITTIGLDLAKNIFQVHEVDETGTVVVVKRLRRNQTADSLVSSHSPSRAGDQQIMYDRFG